MANKFRKTRIDRGRMESLAAAEAAARGQGWRRRRPYYYATAIVWAVVAAFPAVYIGRPLPFSLGALAQTDVHSRVDFPWHDSAAEAQAVKNMESTYARRYREEEKQRWMGEVYTPVEVLLVRSAIASTPEEIAGIADELKTPVTPEQASAIWLASAAAKNDPYHYLVRPLMEILDSEMFPRGLMDQDRFDAENGRSIQVVRDGSPYLTAVGGERGPAALTKAAAELERRIDAKFSFSLPKEFRSSLKEIVAKRLKPTLFYDEAGSKAELAARREELQTQSRTIKQNEILLFRGEQITLDKMGRLREEEREFLAQQDWRQPLSRFGGNLLLFLGLAVSLVLYFQAYEFERPGGVRRFTATLVLCLLPVMTAYLLVWAGLPGTLLPIGLLAGIAALGMSVRTAAFLVAVSGLAGLIIFEGRPDLIVGYLAAGWLFTFNSRRVRRRSLMLLVSTLSGAVGVAAFLAWNLSQGNMAGFRPLAADPGASFATSRAQFVAAAGLLVNWTLCGLAVILILPVIEKYFNITTRIRLQDLANREHPLLRRLILEAPGTFHHSTIVATLAEAGAGAIGADGLAARIGGLFHDIGKLVKPEYFTENEAGVSRHDSLSPHMSALIIVSHVKDGAELAESFGLPSAATDMILQHHGTSVVKYFHHLAVQQAPKGAAVARESFAYPGPRPQTPEAAVVMLADAVEAAVRSQDNPSPQRIRNLVGSLANERLLDGMFEESGITMGQLARVEDVLFRLLVSMYHTRVKYPGQEKDGNGKKNS